MFPVGSSLPLMQNYVEPFSGLHMQLTSEYSILSIPALNSESNATGDTVM